MNKLRKVLLVLLLLELMLGGGGRLTAIGPISLRMLLFGVALAVAAFDWWNGKRPTPKLRGLLLVFAGVVAAGIFLGWLNGSTRTYVWEDVKPLLYMGVLPFLAFSIQDEADVRLAARIVQQSGVVLAVSFFTVLGLIHLKVIPFLDFYHLVLPSEEFFFRGELTFFYKGFVYLCIAFIFFYLSGRKNWVLVLLGLAIVLTFTRGFWLALTGTAAVYYFHKAGHYSSKKLVALVIVSVVLSFAIVWKGGQLISSTSQAIDYLQQPAQPPAPNTMLQENTPVLSSRLLGDRSFSDDSRMRQVRMVLRDMNLASVFVGHGFGQGISIRPIHMEISYLEIFHKQGLIGISFWAFVLLLLWRAFRASSGVPLAESFFFGSLFLFIQSLTNQYINNPIGLGMILLSLVCLERMRTPEPKK